MKRILFIVSMLVLAITANAQVATENCKFFDNMSLGVGVGATTPLDFNSMWPVNANVSVRIAKEFTPVVGLQLEGVAVLNDNHFGDLSTFVKATNVGLNGTVNLSNLFFGYNGERRLFEVSTVTGLGWLHMYQSALHRDFLTAKTGLDLAFNLGKTKSHSLVITPAVYWNLSKDYGVTFNKHNAQLALSVAYVYHFKNSNGTHCFKTYDVGAMNHEITMLRKELSKEKARKPEVVEKIVEKVVAVPSQVVVQFAQNSYALTDDAKAALDAISDSATVKVVGTSSPEGSKTYNMALSEKRAKAVSDYLSAKGVKVVETKGEGLAYGKASNRLSIITVSVD